MEPSPLIDALERALVAAHSIEAAISKLGWRRQLLNAADRPVALLKMATGLHGDVRCEDILGRDRERVPQERHALDFARVLAREYDRLAGALMENSNGGKRFSGNAVVDEGSVELVLSAFDEFAEELCYEFGMSYDDYVDRIGDFEEDD